MNFKTLKTQLSTRVVHQKDFDFGGGIGVQPIHLGNLTYAQRSDLFITRSNAEAGDAKNQALASLNADVVAAALCDEKGIAVVTAAEVKTWDPEIVDRLSTLVMDTVPLGLKRGNDADPSAATN